MPPASEKAIAAAKQKLLISMAELHYFGKTTFAIKTVADSAGYACITGKAVRAAIKELKDEGIFTKSNDEITLTTVGIKSLPKVDESELPNDEDKQATLLELILKEDSDCKPITNPEKTRAVFDTLLDGKDHTKAELVVAAGYKRPDTKQIRNLFKRMVKLGVLENADSKSVRFTDAVWPIQGRPNNAPDKDDAIVMAESPKKQSDKVKATAKAEPPRKTGKQLSGRKRKTLTDVPQRA